MPSPKGYNREEVLDRAIELFRRQGYSATSTAELVDELGMNRKSMYAEFGSKQEVYSKRLLIATARSTCRAFWRQLKRPRQMRRPSAKPSSAMRPQVRRSSVALDA